MDSLGSPIIVIYLLLLFIIIIIIIIIIISGGVKGKVTRTFFIRNYHNCSERPVLHLNLELKCMLPFTKVNILTARICFHNSTNPFKI